MTTIHKSGSQLTITAFTQRPRLIIGLILLVMGTLIALAIFVRLFQVASLASMSLTELPQSVESVDNLPGDVAGGEVLIRLVYGGVRAAIRGQRPVLALALLSAIVGALMLVGYKPGQVAIFDQDTQQVTIRQPQRFWRTTVSQHPFDAISAIPIDQDRSYYSRGDKRYSVQLEIDLQDPAAREESDFVYKKVYSLSAYAHEQAWAEKTVTQIQALL